MTPEECTRLNDLCVRIQSEKNYEKFEALMREVTALMAAKESRFPESKFAAAGTVEKVLSGIAVRTLHSVNLPGAEAIEIRLTSAEPLYSEIRIENSFTDERGHNFALQPPLPLNVKLQAPARGLPAKPPGEATR